VLFCSNKTDLAWETADSRRQTAADVVGIPVSALTGEGIERLLAEVIRHLVPHPPQSGEAVPLSMEPQF
jgi:50S ribosomal subunit-associated GTPase HflX